jgi:uncharacterized protein (UPF0332 family)
MTDDTRRLVTYRLDQAEETLDAARELSAGGHYRDAVNRAYYASRHSGVLSLFNRHFIKTGKFPPEYGRYLREAFELRQGCDYREFVQISLEQVQEIISKAEAFLQQTRRTITDLER